MIHNKLALFREFRMKFKYEILLLSFLFLVFGDLFFPAGFDAMPVLVLQNVLASLVLFFGKKIWRIPLIILVGVLIGLEVLNMVMDISGSRYLFFILYMIYFVVLSFEVYRQILTAKQVDFGMVAAVLCGFIILGLVGGSAYVILEILHPQSFNNIADGVGGVADLIYFSFITILSIGYGDITPKGDIAQKLAMFFGLIGYFYGVVVIGIIMGKYMSRK